MTDIEIMQFKTLPTIALKDNYGAAGEHGRLKNNF